MPKDIVSLIPATSIDSADFAMDFVPMNPAGLPNACFVLYITNAADEDVTISIDGTNVYEYVIAGQRITLFGQNNAGTANNKAYFRTGMVFSAVGLAGTGRIYLTGEYQP